jgi:PIN domain nuclease of toxin-antitoxin system
MTGVLLDTHVLLWSLDDSPRLGHRARARMAAVPAVFVSAVSIWEISIKAAAGKLAIPADFEDAVGKSGYRNLPINGRHAMACNIAALPHKDPFDAMLVAQAEVERLDLLTADEKLLKALPDLVDARL